MSSLLINLIIGFWLLVFGAMAILPFMFEGRQPAKSAKIAAEDRVLSVRPVAPRPRPIAIPESMHADGLARQSGNDHQSQHAA